MCAITTRQGIVEMEANVTNYNAITSAKTKSVETETAQTNTQKPANILQRIPPAYTKINVPMHTLLAKTK